METDTPRKRRWSLLVLLLLLTAGALAWSLWPNRKLSAARALQKELFSPEAGSLSGEERREKWAALRQAREQLTPAQRRELAAEGRKRRQAEMARYFKLSPAEKKRFLDDLIGRMRRPPGGPGGNPGAPAGRPGGQAGQQPGGGPGSSPSPPSAASRDERRRERLDSTSPAERAQTAAFFHDLNARRAQLGLSAGRPFGPGR